MKITFISPRPNLSGGERVIAIYADRLRARGHNVLIVAARPYVPNWKDYLKALALGRTLPRPLELSHYEQMQAPLRLLAHDGPVTAADVPDADVVIATWWETAFMVAILPPEKGRKVYFIQHHEVHGHLPVHLSAGSYHLPLKKITISSWLRNVMAEVYGDHDVALISNSVDTGLFHAPPRGKQKLPTAGFMYAPTYFKGVDVALQALQYLRETHPDLQVIAFGAGPVTKDLPLPPGSRYARAPAQDELRKVYAACDVFLSASRSEGFGLPILEAMACRTPVVATRTGCAADVIENGVNGFVVDVDDAKALAARLCDVLAQDDTSWRAMSEAAYKKTLDYTWDEAVDLFEQAICNTPQATQR